MNDRKQAAGDPDDDDGEGQLDFAAAVALNRAYLEQRFPEAKAAGARWLVECRDMWDAHDRDAGVYFVDCARPRDVDRIVRLSSGGGSGSRVLSIFDLAHPLDEQWPGLTAEAWRASRRRWWWPWVR